MAISQVKAGALLSYVSLGLSNLIGLLYTPFMLRKMGQSEFGLFSLVSSVVAYLTIMDFGFGNAIVRYTAEFRAEGKSEEQYSLFGMFLKIYGAIGIIALIIGVCLYFNVQNLFGSTMNADELSKTKIMMLLLVFNVTITFPLSIFGAIITAYENFVFQKLVSIVRIILNPCIMIPLLLWGYKAIAMVAVITVLNLICLLINWWYCFARLKIKVVFRQSDWALLKEITKYSFLIFLGIIIDRIYWGTGQVILGTTVGTVAVSVFAIAIMLNSYYMSFSTAVSGVFFPKITAMIAKNSSDKEISDLFIKTGRLQYIVLAFLLSGFILFGKSFIALWAGKDYVPAYYMTLILIIPFTIPLIQNLGISILQAKNQLKFRSYLYLAVAALSLAISIPLSKSYEGIGCSIGTSFAMITGNIIAINIYYYKKINIDIPQFWKEIIKMSFPVIVIIVVGFLLNGLHSSNSLSSLGIKILLFSICYIPIIWKYGINQYERNLFTQIVQSLKLKNIFSK